MKVLSLLSMLLCMLVSGCAATAASPMDSPIPWIVFTEEAPAQVAPQRDAEAAFVLAKNAKVSGKLTEDPETKDEWLAFEREGAEFYVRRIHLTRPHPDNKLGPDGNLPYGREIVNRWFGIPIDYEPNDLVTIPEEWARGDNYMLRREACEALVRMFSDAAKEGLHLRVTSPYRSGPRQVEIYTRNIARDPSQRSSAPPGHSEHQLGTTVDLRAVEGGGGQGFANTPESAWLEKNGVRYGWVRTYYPHNVAETGYISEPWHWRYFGPELAPKVWAEKHRGAAEYKETAPAAESDDNTWQGRRRSES